LARKASDLAGLRQMAALHHLDLIKVVLQSYGGRATVDQIQQALVPDVIADDWKKWWDAAKKELKKDGHFQLPTKKTDPIIYQVEETTLDSRLLADFRAAKGLKAKITAASELLKTLGDVKDKVAVGTEMAAGLNADINSHQRTQPSLALEGIFLRDEIRAATGAPKGEGDVMEATIWAPVNRPGNLLEALPAAKQKRALQSYKEANPDKWVDMLLAMLNTTSAKLAGEAADLLIANGKFAELKENLARWISQHQASSELLLWLAKERSDSFADILGPEVFRAMLTAMERDQFNEKRSNRLRDFILDDQSLLVELIGSADLEVIKDLTRALQLSPCFDDMDKRSLLARIVKSYPAVQSLISGDQKKEETTLVVSWDSLERRKNEYQDLVQKKIPANSKEIAIARSYGDLRENHEFKSAKEMQKLLMRRKSELESQMVRARGMDFSQAKTDQVNIGTRVVVTDLDTGAQEKYALLGAWDSDPDRNIVSYLTPVAQALLNKKVGEEANFETHGTKKRYRVESVEAYVATEEERAAANAPKATVETDHGTGHS
jgi:transcription elongation factor GreA